MLGAMFNTLDRHNVVNWLNYQFPEVLKRTSTHTCICNVLSLFKYGGYPKLKRRGSHLQAGRSMPGPATQLAKGYASLFQKNTEKGSVFFAVCMSLILKKKVLFWEDVSTLEKKRIFLGIFIDKGLYSGASSQRFWIKVVFFSPGKISDRGIFFILENNHTSPILHGSGRTGGLWDVPAPEHPLLHAKTWERKRRHGHVS